MPAVWGQTPRSGREVLGTDGQVFPLGKLRSAQRLKPSPAELEPWCVSLRKPFPNGQGTAWQRGRAAERSGALLFEYAQFLSERLKAPKCFAEWKPKRAATRNATPASKDFIYLVIKQ